MEAKTAQTAGPVQTAAKRPAKKKVSPEKRQAVPM